MFLARIDGTLTATRRHKALQGRRMLIAQRLDVEGKDLGEPLVIMDELGAGLGSTVIVSTAGDYARQVAGGDPTTPGRMAVVGIVD